VSWTSDAYAGRSVHQAPNCRTITEIQRKIVKRNQQNVATQLLHANNDRETIGTWRVDLNGVLHVFHVRFVTPVWPLLIVYLQTELAMNTHVVVSDVRHGAGRTRAITSNIPPSRRPTKPPGSFDTYRNSRTGVSSGHKQEQDRTLRITSMNNANMLRKWSTKLLGSEVKETTVDQVKNAPLALSTPAEHPSEPKCAFQRKQSGLLV